jgi:hypothetical protein
MNVVVASDKLERTEVLAEDDETVHWAGAFAVYGGHGTTASSTIVYRLNLESGSAGILMPPKKRSTSSPAPANYAWKTVPLIESVPVAFLRFQHQ